MDNGVTPRSPKSNCTSLGITLALKAPGQIRLLLEDDFRLYTLNVELSPGRRLG